MRDAVVRTTANGNFSRSAFAYCANTKRIFACKSQFLPPIQAFLNGMIS